MPLKTLEIERDDSQWEIGEFISYDNVTTNQSREHRGISSIYRISRYSQQIPLLLPSQDMQ
jgi:hypothetical protein